MLPEVKQEENKKRTRLASLHKVMLKHEREFGTFHFHSHLLSPNWLIKSLIDYF